MKRAVALLGEKEVQSIMRQEGKIEVSWTAPVAIPWWKVHCRLAQRARTEGSLYAGGLQCQWDWKMQRSVMCGDIA